MSDYDHAPFILDEDGEPRLVWRGESSGVLYQDFDMSKTDHQCGFFFAEDKVQADQYAGRGTQARPFNLAARNVLDLTDPYAPAARAFLTEFQAEYDEWIDRFSGEPEDVFTLIENGYLYDYEGNASGARWNHMFRMAHANGFDAVRVMDATDGVNAPVWVVYDPKQIIHAEMPEWMCDTPRRSPKR